MSKHKHNSLSIATKVEDLEKLDQGESVKKLCLDYSVGQSTSYDLKQQRKKILNFYRESDSKKEMFKRRTLHKPKVENIDKVMMEWIYQRCIEGVPLNGNLIM